jgi:hypothetical protein
VAKARSSPLSELPDARAQVIRAAVGAYRRLAAADPAAHEPDLATSLIDEGALAADQSAFLRALGITGGGGGDRRPPRGEGQAAEALWVREEIVRVTERVAAAHRRMVDDMVRWGPRPDDDAMLARLWGRSGSIDPWPRSGRRSLAPPSTGPCGRPPTCSGAWPPGGRPGRGPLAGVRPLTAGPDQQHPPPLAKRI